MSTNKKIDKIPLNKLQLALRKVDLNNPDRPSAGIRSFTKTDWARIMKQVKGGIMVKLDMQMLLELYQEDKDPVVILDLCVENNIDFCEFIKYCKEKIDSKLFYELDVLLEK